MVTPTTLDALRVYAEGLDHPEGVSVDVAGTVWAGGEAGQVYRVASSGAVEEVACTGGFVLGIALDREGIAYACDTKRAGVVRVDPDGGSVSLYSAGAPDAPFRTPNFPVFDDAGNLYVTDSGTWKAADGTIQIVRPGGRAEVWTRDLPAFPNGCALAADGQSLFVIESLRPGVSRVPIGRDGRAGAPQLVCELPGSVPDGLAVDEAGGFFVACYRPDRVYYVDESGRVEIFAEDPQGTVLAAPTNGVFIGADRRTLVLGSLGRWHLTAVDVPVPGVPLRYPSLAGSWDAS